MAYPSMRFGTWSFEKPEGFSISGDSRVVETEIPRRHGSLIVSPIVLKSRNINIRETLIANSPEELRIKYDNLRNVLESGEQKLWLYNDRYINCVKNSFATDYIRGTQAKSAICSMDFVATDPFIYDGTSTTITEYISDSNINHDDFFINNSSFKQIYPKYTITFGTVTPGSTYTLSKVGVIPNNSTSATCELDLTVLVQGFYNTGTGKQLPTNVYVVLRGDTSVIDGRELALDTDGRGTVSLYASTGDYYIVVYHQKSDALKIKTNHLAVITTAKVHLLQGSTTRVVLSDTGSPYYQACYGTAPLYTEIDGKLSMRAGDANADGVVDALDYAIWYAANGAVPGDATWDERADFDGNNAIDTTDYALWFLNNGKYTFTYAQTLFPIQNITLTGFATGEVWIIDAENKTVTKNGVDAIGNFSGDFMYLDPQSIIQLRSAVGAVFATQSVKVEFENVYYEL